MNEVLEFLRNCWTYYLATVEWDQPRVRPFWTINIFEGKLYIQTGKSKNVSRQIQANPKVEISAALDWRWIRVSWELVRDERVEAKKAMLDNYPELRWMYDENDDNTEVLYFKNAVAATAEDYATEFLDYVMSVKVVESLDDAINWVNKYTTHHSEAIITKDLEHAERFQDEVDAAAVYVNASTRFTDGFVFGLGAEIGISTQKMHARGPMGLEALTSTKFYINGKGQIRE